MRPLLSCWKHPHFRSSCFQSPARCLYSALSTHQQPSSPPHDPFFSSFSDKKASPQPKIKTYPPPPSARAQFSTPLALAQTAHLATLDPTGIRTRLFARNNPDTPRTGDVLLATFKTGDPFAGVCLSVRRRGTDTAVLLRGRLMTTGVEMWVKVFSPNVISLEVVKRVEKRMRRARAYFLRKPKHDRGSVENLVENYLKQRRLLRAGALKAASASSSALASLLSGKRADGGGKKGGR